MNFTRVAEFSREKYKARIYRLIHSPCKASEDFDQFYSWLINTWIVQQTDSEDLMKLFIECGFDVKPFIAIVTGGMKRYMSSILNDDSEMHC